MATLTAQQLALPSTLEALVGAGASGDKVAPSGVMCLVLVNTGGATRTATVGSFRNSDQGNDNDLVIAVATGERRYVPVRDLGRFTNPATNYIEWTYDSNANLNVGVFYL